MFEHIMQILDEKIISAKNKGNPFTFSKSKNSPEKIESLESKFEVKLPNDYKKFMQVFNGIRFPNGLYFGEMEDFHNYQNLISISGRLMPYQIGADSEDSAICLVTPSSGYIWPSQQWAYFPKSIEPSLKEGRDGIYIADSFTELLGFILIHGEYWVGGEGFDSSFFKRRKKSSDKFDIF